MPEHTSAGAPRSGGMAPLRAAVPTILVSAVAQACVLLLAGFAPGTVAAHVLSRWSPSGLLDALLPALCLVPLASRLTPAASVVAFSALALLWAAVSPWASHPYETGIWPGLAGMDWLGGIPVLVYGAAFAYLSRRESRPSPRETLGPYANLVTASGALAVGLLGLAALWAGAMPAPGGVLASAALYAGALGGAALKGPAAGMALHVLLRGLGRGPMTAAFLLAAYATGPIPRAMVWGSLGAEGILWIAGVALYVLAAASPPLPSRRAPRMATT